jgi:hypothetical protein
VHDEKQRSCIACPSSRQNATMTTKAEPEPALPEMLDQLEPGPDPELEPRPEPEPEPDRLNRCLSADRAVERSYPDRRTGPRSSASSVGINGMLGAEVCTVLAALRRNSRFQLSSSWSAESPLVTGLKRISWYSIAGHSNQFDAASAVRPFLDIIKSEEANGPVTDEALSSVHRLIEGGFIQYETPSAAQAISEICNSVMETRCADLTPWLPCECPLSVFIWFPMGPKIAFSIGKMGPKGAETDLIIQT